MFGTHSSSSSSRTTSLPSSTASSTASSSAPPTTSLASSSVSSTSSTVAGAISSVTAPSGGYRTLSMQQILSGTLTLVTHKGGEVRTDTTVDLTVQDGPNTYSYHGHLTDRGVIPGGMRINGKLQAHENTPRSICDAMPAHPRYAPLIHGISSSPASGSPSLPPSSSSSPSLPAPAGGAGMGPPPVGAGMGAPSGPPSWSASRGPAPGRSTAKNRGDAATW